MCTAVAGVAKREYATVLRYLCAIDRSQRRPAFLAVHRGAFGCTSASGAGHGLNRAGDRVGLLGKLLFSSQPPTFAQGGVIVAPYGVPAL